MYVEGAAPPAAGARADAAAPTSALPVPHADTLPDSFAALYPIFLLGKLSPAAKSALWARYQTRAVRWSGRLVSFTRDGFAIRAMPGTLSFDVSVTVDAAARPHLARHKVGDWVTFTGRLNGYDDAFLSFYLKNGVLLDEADPYPGPDPDTFPPIRVPDARVRASDAGVRSDAGAR